MAATGGRSFHGGDTVGLVAASGLLPRDILDASANINPLGPPDWLDAAFAEGRRVSGRYPDPACRDLRAAASLALEVPADCLVFGNGADELMFALARALGRPTSPPPTHPVTNPSPVHIIEAPSYASYRDAALEAAVNQTGASRDTRGTEPTSAGTALRVIPARLPQSFGASILGLPTATVPLATEQSENQTDNQRWSEALAASSPGSILWIGAPNNPTGLMPEGYPDVVVRLAQTFPEHFVLCDEAFIDFADGAEPGGASQAAARLPNLVVIRSMTKFWAVPGLRAGYVICHPQTAVKLRGALPNWPLNCVAEAFARRAFTDPLAGKRRDETRRLVSTERARIAAALSTLPSINVRESSVNFYLLHVQQDDSIFAQAAGNGANRRGLPPDNFSAEILADALASRGIGLRRCASFPRLGTDWLRIAVRSPEENDRIVQAIQEILFGQNASTPGMIMMSTNAADSVEAEAEAKASIEFSRRVEVNAGTAKFPFDHLRTNGQTAPSPSP